MAAEALHQLFTGLIMSKITHALPALQDKCNISRKALRRGVTHTAFDIEEIIDNFDRKLSPRLPTPVIVYTIYFLLKKPLNTVLTVLGKENTA